MGGHWSYTVPGMSVRVLKMAEAVILYVMGSLHSVLPKFQALHAKIEIFLKRKLIC